MGRLAVGVYLSLVLAAAWPPEGYVDLDALVQRQQSPERLVALRATAAVLRRSAEQTETGAGVPPPPAAGAAGSNGLLPPEDAEAEARAIATEVAIYQAVLADQVATSRLRELTPRSAEVFRRLRTFQTELTADQAAWLRALAELTQAPRLDLQLRLGLGQRIDQRVRVSRARLNPLEAEGVQKELAAWDAVLAAVTDRRRTELGQGWWRYRRQQVLGLQARLDQEALAALREADRLLARREAELADQAAQRTAYQQDRLAKLGPLTVDLQLDDWRRELGSRAASASGRRDQHRQAALATAAALEAEASRLSADSGAARRRVLAWLRVIERSEKVRLRLKPAAGLPDLTERVAAQLDQWAAEPPAVAPTQKEVE